MARRQPDTIYARVTPGEKKRLTDFAARSEFKSERDVIEKLLKYFNSLGSDQERLELLRGVRFSEFGQAVERLAWADHAFGRKRWAWALEEYLALERVAGEQAPGLRRLAQYKQSYCWLDLGIQLRKAALKWIEPGGDQGRQRNLHFDAARQAVAYSIALGEEHFKSNVPHRVVLFNVTCSWSLLAQYSIEQRLANKGTPDCKEIVKELKGALEGEHPRELQEGVWTKIGRDWRDFLQPQKGEKSEKTDLEGFITIYTSQAMANLEKLVARDQNMLPKDYHFLVVLAEKEKDPDLLFLRHDRGAAKGFTEWCKRERGEDSVLQSFENLRKELPEPIQESANGALEGSVRSS